MPQNMENDANLASNNPHMHSSITHTYAGVSTRRMRDMWDLYRA